MNYLLHSRQHRAVVSCLTKKSRYSYNQCTAFTSLYSSPDRAPTRCGSYFKQLHSLSIPVYKVATSDGTSIPRKIVANALSNAHNVCDQTVVSKVGRRLTNVSCQSLKGGASAITETASAPLSIVLCSWLGARPKHFSKYVEAWQGLGYPRVLGLRTPISSVLFPPLGDVYSQECLAQIQQLLQQSPESKVLLHIFSGGGFILAGTIFRALQQQSGVSAGAAPGLMNRVAGIVFDSSPSPVNADVGSRALVAAALGEPAEEVEQRHPQLVKSVETGLGAYMQLPPIQSRIDETWNTWRTLPITCPQLYLYSDTDVLVPTQTIEGWAEEQERKGCRVVLKKWHDSAHVEHMRMHPEEYKQQLLNFTSQLQYSGGAAKSARNVL